MEATARSEPAPRRWIGAVTGALASLGVAGVAAVIGEEASSGTDLVAGINGFVGVGLAGSPVGALLGWLFYPSVRSAGLRRALGLAVLMGVLAPPIGGLELLAWALVAEPTGSEWWEAIGAWFMLAPFALVVSYAAIVATVPAALAWMAAVRALPADPAAVPLRSRGSDG